MSQPARVLLFGGTGGIGSEAARLLASGGHRVGLVARDEGKLGSLSGDIGAVFSQTANACEFESVQAAVGAFVQQEGGLDAVANFVGSIILKPAHATSLEEWAQTIDQNLNSSFYIAKAALPALQKDGGGSLLFSSSAVAGHGFAAHEAIAAAKSGVEGLMRSIAASYATRNVRANCIAPGLTDTPLASGITGNDAALKASTAMHALGRIGTSGDAGRAAAFLLDPANAHITGQVLRVDGGLGGVRPK